MKLSKASLWVIAIVYMFSLLYYTKWDRQSITNGGDSFGYYVYLPSIFIHNDLKDLRHTIYARNGYSGLYQDSTVAVKDIGEIYFFKTGTPVIKYTCGIAILESPAFFTAHLIARLSALKADGFSAVYLIALYFWNALFILLGLILLRKILLLYFSDYATAATLLGIGIGTNLYHFTVYNPGMSHGYLLTLYAGLIYATIRYHINFSYKNAAVIGLCTGMIALIRPNEAIAVFIPVFYGIASFNDAKLKLLLLKQGSIYLALAVFLLCLTPQIAYWLYTTGHVFYYSYGGESFDFRHPHLKEGLIGYANGWLPYAPIMFIALLGIPFLLTKRTKLLLPLLIILPIHIYVIYSWWCFFYINGIGSRPMIEMSALLAFPMAAFMEWGGKIRILKPMLIILVFVFAMQQFSFTWRHDRNLLWTEAVNKTFYWQTMFKPKLDYDDLVVLDTDEKQPHNPKFIKQIYFTDFEDSTNARFVRNVCGSGNFSALIDTREVYWTIFEDSIGKLGVRPGDWIKVEFDACNIPPPASIWNIVGMNTSFSRSGKMTKYVYIRVQNKYPEDKQYMVYRFDPYAKGKAHYYTQVPADALPTDKVSIFTGNFSSTSVAIDNLSVELWRK